MTTAQRELNDWLEARRNRQPEAFDWQPLIELVKPVAVFALCLAFGLGVAYLTSGDGQPPRPNYAPQIAQAQEFVRAALKAPASASFPWTDYNIYGLGGGKLMVSSHVDAQNGFGANIRTRWSV